MKDEIKEIISIYNAILENKDVLIKEARDFNDYVYIEYCGIKTPNVRKGNTISKGDTLGESDTDVNVSVYDSKKNKEYIEGYFPSKESIGKNITKRGKIYIIPAGNTQKIKSPKNGEVSGEIYNPDCVNQIVIKYQKESTTNTQNTPINTPKNTNIKGEKESDIVKFLFNKKYREELGNIITGKVKSDNDDDESKIDKPDREKGWLNRYFDKISTTKKVQENVNRIKGLLK
jgi:hypothetical protein